MQNAGAPGEGEVVLRASFFAAESPSAVPLGTAEATLAPGGFLQWSLAEVAPRAAGRQGYVRVERVRGSAPYYAYGVLNDNGTSDGSFVVPQSGGAAATAGGLSLPVVVEAGVFSTEVVVTNISESASSLELTYVSKEIPSGAATALLTVPARGQVLLPGFVDWLRRQPGSVVPSAGPGFVGPLLVTARTSSLEGITVSGRTSTPAEVGDGRYGLYYAAVPFGASNTTPVSLMGLRQDGENRTNAAFVNTGELSLIHI